MLYRTKVKANHKGGETMNEALMWVLIVFAIAVLIPVVGHIIRKRDFDRQVAGKKPMRSFKEGDVDYGDAQQKFNLDLELEVATNATKGKGVVNIMGPK